VVDDEYYYYKKPIPIRNELSPLLMKLVGEELLLRETEAKSEVIEAPAQNEVRIPSCFRIAKLYVG